MNEQLKAIDTEYNGYLFRSRLEARWAVFFDALGIKYEYEKEGYDTPAGYYLPDFWLPETTTFIEIKPADYCENSYIMLPSIDPRWEYVNVKERLVIVCGTPGEVFDPYSDKNSYQGFIICDFPYYWAECPECGCVDIHFDARSGRNRNHKKGCINANGDKQYNWSSPRLNHAYNAARKARFEHGSRGVIRWHVLEISSRDFLRTRS